MLGEQLVMGEGWQTVNSGWSMAGSEQEAVVIRVVN